jgi:DNA-binding HxlR family transcriptional regulator
MQAVSESKEIKRKMRPQQRSGCPINLTMEVLGDRWSLVIIRDMMFGNWRHFRDLQRNSIEGIASNTLAARLKHLVEIGMLSRRDDPTHKQKAIYSLTEKAIQLVPVFAVIGAWGCRHLPVTRELSIRAELLENGGQELWNEFMDELRTLHLENENRDLPVPSVLQKLNDAYLAVVNETKSVQQELQSAPKPLDRAR